MTNKSRIVDYDNIYIWVHVNLGTQFTVAIQWSNYHKYTLPLKLDTVLISGVHSWVLPPSSQHSGSCKVPVSPEYCPLPSGHMVWNGSLTPWVFTPFHRIQGQGIVPASPEYCPLLIGLRVRAWFLHPLSIAPSPQDSGSRHVSCFPWVLPPTLRTHCLKWFPYPLSFASFSFLAIQWSNYHKYTLPLKLDTVLISGVHSSVLPPSSQHSGSGHNSCLPWVLPLLIGLRVRAWFLHPLNIATFSQDSGSGHSSCIPWVLPLPYRIQGHGMIPASSEYCPSLQDSRFDFCIPWILPCPHRTRVRTGFLHPLAESSPGMHGSGFSSYSQISLVSDHFQGCQNYIFKIFFNLFTCISFGYKILNFIEHKLQNENSFLKNLPCNNSFKEHFVEVQLLDNESSKC